MRIAWVKVGGLWPLETGGRLRSFHLLAQISRRHRVCLLTTHEPGDDAAGLAAALPDVEDVWSAVHRSVKSRTPAFASAVARSWLSRLPLDLWRWRVPALAAELRRRLAAGEVDCCVADFLSAAPNVPGLVAGGAPPLGTAAPPVVLFEHNAEHVIWRRLAALERRPWRQVPLEIEWRKLRRAEAQACERAAATIAVSDVDRGVLCDAAPAARVAVIPTGVDTDFFSPVSTGERRAAVVFSGSMDWYPNEDAVLHFIDAMLPPIRAEIPDVSVTVVGRRPGAALLAAAERAGVRVTGTVDDVRPYVGEAEVFVVPLRIGGGTRLKIFEALAMGRAVVSTTVGAEGLPLVNGRHFVCADEPAAFARAVVDLLRNPVRRRALGAAGRALVKKRYSWRHVAHDFERIVESAVVRVTDPGAKDAGAAWNWRTR